jgi:hypothetical protein
LSPGRTKNFQIKQKNLDVSRSFILIKVVFVQMLDSSLIGNPVKIGDGPAAVTPTFAR